MIHFMHGLVKKILTAWLASIVMENSGWNDQSILNEVSQHAQCQKKITAQGKKRTSNWNDMHIELRCTTFLAGTFDKFQINIWYFKES